MVFLKEFFEKVDFEKIQQMTKKHEKVPSMQRVKIKEARYHRICHLLLLSRSMINMMLEKKSIFLSIFLLAHNP